MKALPNNVTAYKRTPEFDELSVPAGLLKAHQTKEQVWAKIIVYEGELQYTINEPITEVNILNKANAGIVEPTVLHEIKPLGSVRFVVEFYR
tara:strand:+ start:116 stop:391 length:276 start_codon:yes stop_codon:yes gene_type:complete